MNRRPKENRTSHMVRQAVIYAALTICGIFLYFFAAEYAEIERGYQAIGGEIFLLFLPLFYYFITAFGRDEKEDDDN